MAISKLLDIPAIPLFGVPHVLSNKFNFTKQVLLSWKLRRRRWDKAINLMKPNVHFILQRNKSCIVYGVDNLHTGFNKTWFNKWLFGVIDF